MPSDPVEIRVQNVSLMVLGSLLLLPFGLSAQTSAPARQTAPAITVEDLRARVFAFADDSMQGRASGTPGHVKATDYLARELARLGLEPAGEQGTYFQTIPLRQTVAEVALTVGGAPLTQDRDILYLPSGVAGLPFGGALAGPETSTVFGGRLGAPNAITPEAAAGKIVVFLPPLGPDGQPVLGFWGHPVFRSYAGAAGFLVPALEQVPRNITDFLLQPQTQYVEADAEDPVPGPFAMFITTATAERIVGPLATAAPGRAGQPLRGTAAWTRRDLASPARNVIAILRGRDPVLRHQYVAIGAHSDHVGIAHPVVEHDSLRAFNTVVRPRGADDGDKEATEAERAHVRAILDSLRALRAGRPDSIANGADDDASGSMAVLEIAEAFAAATEKPRRSLLFVWHAAEEMGLFGSQHFTDYPTVPRDSIVAQINVDMVGRGGRSDLAKGGPGYVQLIGSRRISTELGDLVEQRNVDGRFGMRFDYTYDANGHPDQYYCRSDHYNYARYGIPVVFLSTGGHRDYHQVTDEPQYLDYTQLQLVTRFMHDLMGAIANRDRRFALNGPLPDPHGECVQ